MFQEIIDKISRYNVFNHLLPGAIFSIWVTEFTEFNMVQSDILSNLFLYYFVGVVLSRIGSVLIEPVLKCVQFVKYEPYDKYLLAAKDDQKIETLVEANNSYRTFLSVFLCALFLKLYLLLKTRFC